MSAAAMQRALAWLVALPALLFATPLSPLDADPWPHLAGAGWAAIALVPLAVAAILRGAAARGAWPFTLALAWALVALALADVTDVLEARRALLALAPLPLAFAAGANLGVDGRRTFEALLVALSCTWTAVALALGGGFAGVLGDTGSLSQAALPGAAVASAWVVRERGARRAAGGLALLLFLAHVAVAPVIAGSHTLLAALLLASWRNAGRGRGALAGLALVALIAPFAGMAARGALYGTRPDFEGAPPAAAGPAHTLGGLGVRGLVWKSTLGLVADHPLAGAGPGQFQAAFPPRRDPREIELSRHGVCSELDTEVEHAHNDWLQGFAELGFVGGGLMALGLALAARAAFRALADDERLPLATAALALLVNAFVHAPLSGNPAAAALCLAVLGASSAPERGPRRIAAALQALPVLAAACFAPPLIAHGRAMSDRIDALRTIDALQQRAAPPAEFADALRAEQDALERALAAAPQSAPARMLHARRTRSVADWDAALALRPHAVEAWEQSATELAIAGRTAEARERYAHALALSPTHPRIWRNLARLEFTQGDAERGLAAVETLRGEGCLAPAWAAALGGELVLVHGLPTRGAPLVAGHALAELVPEELHARAEEAEDANALECLAQLLWARQHAERGDFAQAVRSYRQARDKSRAGREGPAALYSLELAAAELRAGRSDDAREHAEEAGADARTWAELPEWARAALGELGLAPEAP